MSCIWNVNIERFIHENPNLRTLAVIRKEAVGKKGKRNTRSRLFHSKDSESVIAGWKQDLFRILQIFHVRSVGPSWRQLMLSRLDRAVGAQPYDTFGRSSSRVSGTGIH